MPHGTIILTPGVPTAKKRIGKRGPPLLSLLLLCLLLLGAVALPGQAQVSPGNPDEDVLKKAGVGTDAAGLLQFFRQRSLEEDRRNLDELIRKLDSGSFREREQASQKLVALGTVAVPYLKRAMQGAPLEVVRRAEICISKIARGPGPELPAAAARLLAQRRPAEGIEVLLGYLPHVDDEMVEEEVLASLGALGVHPGKVDARLTAALRGPSAELRAAVAYVVAQSGGPEEREAVRQLLEDPDARVRSSAASGLVGKRAWQAAKEISTVDEALLRDHKIAVTEPELLGFLRKRSLDEAAQARLRDLVRQLGDGSYRQREEASRKLLSEGSPALPFLKEALDNPDAETVRRAELCIERIQRGPGPALPAAVVRLLVRQSPGAAISALLGYLPFADDDTVEQEVLNSLCLLSVRQVKIDPALPGALHDPLPARRGAAAYVLGHIGGRQECAGLAGLLKDASLKVRFRSAQGLLAARDRSAVPELIGVAADAPTSWCWRVDEVLQRLAAGKGPDLNLANATAEGRKKAVKEWADWWRTQGETVDLARLTQRDAYMGLTLICEYDSVLGRPGGRVFECGKDTKPRWQLRDIMGPMDAQVLPGGRLLIAENMAQRVTERDMAGNIKWEYRVPNNPIACRRLPNGNTFIATYTQVMEVSAGGQLVYSHGNTPGFYIFSAQKLRDGRIVCMNGQGVILEMDSATGRMLRQINVGQAGGWCSVEVLPSGRFLVAMMSVSKVREVDANGQTQWECTFPGVFRASRLPNGNTLVVSMTTRRVAEVDRAGTVRWETVCEGRPWQARYR